MTELADLTLAQLEAAKAAAEAALAPTGVTLAALRAFLDAQDVAEDWAGQIADEGDPDDRISFADYVEALDEEWDCVREVGHEFFANARAFTHLFPLDR